MVPERTCSVKVRRLGPVATGRAGSDASQRGWMPPRGSSGGPLGSLGAFLSASFDASTSTGLEVCASGDPPWGVPVTLASLM